jgi:MoxR-like ATPase
VQAFLGIVRRDGFFPQLHAARQLVRLVDQISTIIVGKRPQIEDCVACLLAGGHLLIEDVPGRRQDHAGARAGGSLGLEFRRVQFTADLMPSDLIGVSVFERSKEAFVFHPGPVFAQVLLADEINRAGPKTQSALLEAMEEQQVSVENETRPLPQPFFVIATQNPSDQLGTYPLPESQLDRFLLRITLGYPDRASERELLAGEDRRAACAAAGAGDAPGRADGRAAGGAAGARRPTRCWTTCRR